MGNKINFNDTFAYKLIYVFGINDGQHEEMLKVGDATVHTNKKIEELIPNCKELNESAKKRINSYTRTAGILYELLWTELAVTNKNKSFRDYKVHDVLLNSGIEKVYFDKKNKANEWFKTDLETVKNAIKAVKKYEMVLSGKQISKNKTPIIFRPEQKEAIEKTKKRFKNGNSMLWNAKMRFGKTLSALQVIKDLEIKKTIIVTHRPVVESGWREDFNKIFYDREDYKFITKDRNGNTYLEKEKGNYVFFASLQDLRGAEQVGGNFDKNLEIFKIDWDLVIVDEAHEGTQTKLAKNVRKELVGEDTKLLLLSGTPFNLLDQFDEKEIYTWDYIMEQKAKEDWTKNHYLDSNPYEELPRMNIYTYYLNELFKGYDKTENDAFNFKEFFRVYKGNKKIDGKDIPKGKNIGDFVHEEDIVKFLNLLVDDKNDTNYPFSTEEYREFFRHTLWVLPGVNEAKALSKLLKENNVFRNFEIVNVAGNGDEEEEYNEALKKVENAMTDKPEETYTITLTCGRLTTGVSVKPWTAVFMLAGSYSTSASSYLQTIFRVQTPANIGGRIKEQCYVFDFAPDRTLNMVAEAVSLNTKAGIIDLSGKQEMGEFLNFCPVIAIKNSQMIEYNVDKMLQQLKRAYAERVARNGFDDTKIYNDNLNILDRIELEKFKELQQIIGKTNQTKKINQIIVNDNGFTEEEYEKIKEIEKKPKKERTPEEEEKLKQKAEVTKRRKTAASILRGISIRIPLMIYGADIDINKDITPENFIDIVDDESWKEFMPKGVTKEKYKEFTKYYDRDIFINAGRSIRNKAYRADSLQITERVQKIAEIFSTFKNPDKETVLTPWRVVNMHLGETFGGCNFYDENYENELGLNEIRYIDKGKITKEIFENNNTKVLEINSKTGLYPLYIAYTLYNNKLKKYNIEELTKENEIKIWDEIIDENIFIICKTPMAKSITKRTLLGYRESNINTRYFSNLTEQLKEKRKEENLIKKIKSGKAFKKGKEFEKEMKFDAVVGNPPYQGNNHQQIYTDFYLLSRKLGKYVSLIFPTGWQSPKNANNLSKLNKKEIKEDSQIVYIDNRQNVFPGIPGAEWVNIILWNKNYNNKLNGKQKIYTNGEDPKVLKLNWENDINDKPKEIIELFNIVKKYKSFKSIQNITSSRKPFGLGTDIFNKKDENIFNERKDINDFLIYGSSNSIKYMSKDLNIKFKSDTLEYYKVLVPYAWGNMSEKTGLGGAFSDIIIANPNEICTETYLVSGKFENKEDAKKHAKYLMSKFARALLYLNKFSQHSTTSWGAIPIQDYTEEFWNGTIKEIDKALIKKYNIPSEIAEYIDKNIQTKYTNNIINY